MADISTDQLNAIYGLVAQQQQADSVQQERQRQIEQLSGLVNQEIQKTSQDAEVEKLLNRYKQIGGESERVKGIAESGSRPVKAFSLFSNPFTETYSLSPQEKLNYLQESDRLEKEKASIAEKLRAYLPKEPEKARPASELKAPEQSQATPQPAQAAVKTEDGIPVVKAERLTPFDEFNIINQRRQQFIEDSMNDIASLPRGLRDRGMKLVKELADQSFKLPENVAIPIINASTGQAIPKYGLLNGKIVDMGDETPKVTEKNLTAEQSAALQFGTAMADSSKRLASLMEGEGYNPASLTAQLPVPDILKGQNRRRYQGIVTDFALALNRKTSGAAVSEQEYDRVEKLFFPQPGDTPAVVRDKAERRQREINTILSNVPDFAKQKLDVVQSQQQQQGGQGGPARFTRGPGGELIIQK
jgi:hypothetical protein